MEVRLVSKLIVLIAVDEAPCHKLHRWISLDSWGGGRKFKEIVMFFCKNKETKVQRD